MPHEISGPTSHIYYSQRLRLHYVDWGNEGAPPLLLVHGGQDHCRNWDWVAQSLRAQYHIIAPDLRGHGDSQWVIGSTYRMDDYVYDIRQLLLQRQLFPVRIVAHSLGGAIALRYAGLYPEKVLRLVAIEGLGPSPKMLAERKQKAPHERLDEWMENVRNLAGRQPRRYESVDEAYKRMQDANPHLTPEQARHLTIHGTTQNEDGTYSWKFDNYVRVFSPEAFSAREAKALWARISCPTLLIRGKESWASDPEKDGRAALFPDARVLNVDGAGHWVHHDQLDLFLDAVSRFLAD